MTGAVLQTLLTGRWQLQTAFSSARFTVGNLGVRTVHGQLPIREAGPVSIRQDVRSRQQPRWNSIASTQATGAGMLTCASRTCSI